jgi:putative Mn2+ efflux pump MntP
LTSLELLVLSAALGTDLFSVAVPIGMNRMRRKIIFRAAVVFALFHIVLILAGYNIGHFLGSVVEHVGTQHSEYPLLVMENWASILGALVLIGLGIYMIRENVVGAVSNKNKTHPLQGFSLFVLATSVSLDALAAGFSMGMMDVDLVKLSLILGSVIFFIALLGLGLGRRVGRYIGGRAEFMGGVVLALLGVHVLWTLFYL